MVIHAYQFDSYPLHHAIIRNDTCALWNDFGSESKPPVVTGHTEPLWHSIASHCCCKHAKCYENNTYFLQNALARWWLMGALLSDALVSVLCSLYYRERGRNNGVSSPSAAVKTETCQRRITSKHTVTRSGACRLLCTLLIGCFLVSVPDMLLQPPVVWAPQRTRKRNGKKRSSVTTEMSFFLCNLPAREICTYQTIRDENCLWRSCAKTVGCRWYTLKRKTLNYALVQHKSAPETLEAIAALKRRNAWGNALALKLISEYISRPIVVWTKGGIVWFGNTLTSGKLPLFLALSRCHYETIHPRLGVKIIKASDPHACSGIEGTNFLPEPENSFNTTASRAPKIPYSSSGKREIKKWMNNIQFMQGMRRPKLRTYANGADSFSCRCKSDWQ